jgi:hypothetical protein
MAIAQEIRQGYFEGERSLFASKELKIYDTVFGEGESPLKESSDIYLESTIFQWKYPLWYGNNIEVKHCTWCDMARAGIWYTNHIRMQDTMMEAPKNFRRCKDVTLEDVYFSNAEETLWNCDSVTMKRVTAQGDYFAMNTNHIQADGLQLVGNYSFDGCRDVEIHNARLLSKDAFWNSDNITVYDSFISGEYLGWNAKNLTLINCTIESLQGMCYIDNLVMKNCKLINTTLAFEYSTVEADITGTIDSVINPTSGTIKADHIKKLILEKERIDPSKTKIICRED